jgi:hypothetical protein
MASWHHQGLFDRENILVAIGAIVGIIAVYAGILYGLPAAIHWLVGS